MRERALWHTDHKQWQAEQDKRFYMWGAGVFPQPLREQQGKMFYQYSAETAPRIPAWFGERPALKAVFLLEGKILAYGPLNLNYEERPGNNINTFWQDEGEPWYLYAPDGRLLNVLSPPRTRGRFEHQMEWKSLFVDFSAVEQGLSERGIKYGRNDLGTYRAYVQHEPKTDGDWGAPTGLLAIYDLDGNVVDPDSPWRDEPYVGILLGRQQIQEMYKSQVELGIVDPTEKSPYEGTSEGPVAVDPTPRPRPILARKHLQVPHERGGWTSGGEEVIKVQPLDHPDNPYRGQYGPWDEWILSQQGIRNPREEAHMQEQSRRMSEEIRKAQEEGRKPETSGMWRGYMATTDDPWTRFSMRVDEQGFVMPLLVREEQQSMERKQREQRSAPSIYMQDPPAPQFRIEAGGVMPPEIAGALLQELKQRGLREFPPQPPAWMKAAPPHSFMVMPNGEYVTNGPLGSWKENWQLEYMQPIEGSVKNDRASRGWYRYSANGELLGSVPEGSWLQLFNPTYSSLELSGKSQGYEAYEYSGYLIWVKKGTPEAPLAGDAGAIVAKWDYLGNSVAPDTPLVYPDWRPRLWPWDEVVRVERGMLPQSFY